MTTDAVGPSSKRRCTEDEAAWVITFQQIELMIIIEMIEGHIETLVYYLQGFHKYTIDTGTTKYILIKTGHNH